MERNSLIDLSKPVIIIQIQDDNYVQLMTNMDDQDDVIMILEDLLDNIAEMEVNSFIEASKVIKRLQ